MKDLKQKVLENLKTKGYPEYQLKELNPIIQATIEATRQALSLGAVSNSALIQELRLKLNDMEKVGGVKIRGLRVLIDNLNSIETKCI